MYMWNQVNYNQSHYANLGTSAPYNHCSYLKVPCPHQVPLSKIAEESDSQEYIDAVERMELKVEDLASRVVDNLNIVLPSPDEA